MLAKLFKVSRPISWINTAFPFAAGYLVLGGQVDWIFTLGTLFFLIPYNLLMYGVNDVFDYESDIKNPRKGSIEGAVEAKAFHPVILRACLITCLPFLLALAFFMPTPAYAVLLGVVFFAIAYSIKGLRFKEIPILDSITSSLHFVGPLLVAIAVLTPAINVWPYVIAFFLWGIASHAFGAVQDIIPDRKGKLHSIATVFGARATVWISLACYVGASVIVATQGQWTVAVAGLAYVINIAPYMFVTDKASAKTNTAWRRFIWINYAVGAVVTITLITAYLS